MRIHPPDSNFRRNLHLPSGNELGVYEASLGNGLAWHAGQNFNENMETRAPAELSYSPKVPRSSLTKSSKRRTSIDRQSPKATTKKSQKRAVVVVRRLSSLVGFVPSLHSKDKQTPESSPAQLIFAILTGASTAHS
jgi:hypothetical protein